MNKKLKFIPIFIMKLIYQKKTNKILYMIKNYNK